MNTEEKLKELESEIEEIKDDLGTKTISTRGFEAFSTKDPNHYILTVHIGCRGLSKTIPIKDNPKYPEGCYRQMYNVYCYFKFLDTTLTGSADIIFSKDNEIIGCLPFEIKTEDEIIKYVFNKTLIPNI